MPRHESEDAVGDILDGVSSVFTRCTSGGNNVQLARRCPTSLTWIGAHRRFGGETAAFAATVAVSKTRVVTGESPIAADNSAAKRADIVLV